MNRRLRVALLCFGVALVATMPAFGKAAAASTPTHSVGYRVLEIPVDGKPLAVAVWYPTDRKARSHNYGPPKSRGRVAENAPIKAGSWPLVVFSHGFSGSGVGQVELTEKLAARGFIVAAPDHSDEVTVSRIRGGRPGNLESAMDHLRTKKPFNRVDYAYRPREVQAVLDGMLRQTELPMNAEKIALAGHSMGGWSAMSVALTDPRVQAVVLYSMGELHWLAGNKYFEAEELHQLTRPSIYFYGEQEKPLNSRGMYADFCFWHSAAPSYLVEIAAGNHFTYNDRSIAPRAGGTPPQQGAIAETTAAFLDKHLLGKDATVTALRDKSP